MRSSLINARAAANSSADEGVIYISASPPILKLVKELNSIFFCIISRNLTGKLFFFSFSPRLNILKHYILLPLFIKAVTGHYTGDFYEFTHI